MRPISLHGHSRPITKVKYNREGDLLFTSAKNATPTVWFSSNGERLGTFDGHTGVVWDIDISWDTANLLSAAGDNQCKLWDCQTGKNLNTLATRSAVRSCGFSYSGNMIMLTTDAALKQLCEIQVYDLRDPEQMEGDSPCVQIPVTEVSKVTSSLWCHLDDHVVTGHEYGEICKWDIRAGGEESLMTHTTPHGSSVNDIQMNKDQTLFITSSKDQTAKLFVTRTLEHIKTYQTDRAVNSAAIAPDRPHVAIGGGMEAREQALTSAKLGKLDAQLFHLIFEEEFGRIKGHFGPINSLAFNPDGKSFCTGGEDGFVRINYFDPEYFEFDIER